MLLDSTVKCNMKYNKPLPIKLNWNSWGELALLRDGGNDIAFSKMMFALILRLYILTIHKQHVLHTNTSNVFCTYIFIVQQNASYITKYILPTGKIILYFFDKPSATLLKNSSIECNHIYFAIDLYFSSTVMS